jgi:hypothetical protein
MSCIRGRHGRSFAPAHRAFSQPLYPAQCSLQGRSALFIRSARRQVLCWVYRAIRTGKHVSADRTAPSRPRTASSPVIAARLITQCPTPARRRSRLSIARCSATAMGISRPAHAPKTPRARGSALPAVCACRHASGAAALMPPEVPRAAFPSLAPRDRDPEREQGALTAAGSGFRLRLAGAARHDHAARCTVRPGPR